MKVFSLIPARGGSKGIRRKNIRILNGHPLIYYTIRCSLAAKRIQRTIVSTEDREIAAIARQCGAEVPFYRPGELAKDHVLDYPVVRHCLDYLIDQEGWKPDVLVFLRPTMPFRNAEEIDRAVEMLARRPDLDSVRTTRPVPYPPYWMKTIDARGCIQPFDKAAAPYQYTRRQDLPKVVMCDGYVDVTRVDAVLKYEQVVCGRIFALQREGVPFMDIDTPDNWDYCEYLMKKMEMEDK